MADVAFPEGLRLPQSKKDKRQQPEQTEKQVNKVSRRWVLRAASAAAALAVEEMALGTIRKTADKFIRRSPAETKIPPLPFESLRNSISTATGSEEIRTKLLERLGQYEMVNNTLDEIRNANESFKEPDGIPTLVTQTKKRLFGDADTSIFWQGKFTSEREFLEAQVDILAPLRYQKVLIGDLLSELAAGSNKADLNAFAELTDSGTHRRSDLPKVGYSPEGSRQTVTMPEFDQAFRDIFDFGTEKPKVGQIEVKPAGPISPTLQNLFEQDKQKVLARIGNLPFPEDITVIISSDRYGVPFDSGSGVSWQEAGGTLYRDESGKMVLSLRVELDDYSGAVHEAGHYFEGLGKFLKPKDLIAYKIAIERVLSDPKIGRNYPNLELLFNKDRQNAGAIDDLSIRFGTVKNPDLFRYTTGDYPDGVWIRQARQGPLTGDKGIFGNVLPYKMIDSFSKQTPIPFEGFDFSKFVIAEKIHFDQLAASDPVWAYAVGEIRKNPQRFDGTVWIRSSSGRVGAEIGTLPTFDTKGINYTSYWKSVNTFGQTILADAFVRGELVVLQALSKLPAEAKDQFLRTWRYNLVGQSDKEKWAETFNLAISHPELVPSGTNSFADFKNLMQNLLGPGVAQAGSK